MFDYESMRLIWWLFIGVVAIAFALTEGFDFGISTLLPFVGKTDIERRIVINSVGPVWEGNQVWLILLGGAIFAIWPSVYATLFSGLYLAMMLVLFSLFFRPAGFDYRNKLNNPSWRNTWDWCLFLGGTLPPVLLGVLAGNLILGLPFHLDQDLRSFYDGSFFGLLSPFALLCGVVCLTGTSFHGALFLKCRTEGVVQARSRLAASILGLLLIVGLAAVMTWIFLGLDRPEITQIPGGDAPSNPLNKTVIAAGPGWLAHFMAHPLMLIAPALGMLALSLAWLLGRGASTTAAFIFSCLGIAGMLTTLGLGLFPFLLISSTAPGSSLTLWDATSSHKTLVLAFWITIIFLPIVLLYTRWVYKVIWGSITEASIIKDTHTLY